MVVLTNPRCGNYYQMGGWSCIPLWNSVSCLDPIIVDFYRPDDRTSLIFPSKMKLRTPKGIDGTHPGSILLTFGKINNNSSWSLLAFMFSLSFRTVEEFDLIESVKPTENMEFLGYVPVVVLQIMSFHPMLSESVLLVKCIRK